ncbi:hypothetical protein PICSAR11_04027 [Mycobacterium avium subsp. paratuberculosis]|nr:hypothetical protein PICSAR103_00193 [Mycobacterium avium subsp. paratuberculosis]CAG6852890.1 hypothetical protein PICSAR100_00195 [Mycobacterium avium subsp. paratuberculosis]CAG6875901.1 hypothetical protein PICSAR118_01429 [Mycobacterium avium subsp. paratuberculosis]CAG6926939.1 hypothetical protein PICSAR10_03912 [Mycobacterium avium subsp. paratuberculosis]CAG6928027.1 hypothetical protein PICSAR11_04027 [Mycobacterium avium subsp. paratuberculosis]
MPVVGRGKGAGVELAVDGHRQRIQHHHRGRDHVGGQPFGQRGARLGRGHRSGDVADQALVPGVVLAGDDDGLLHPVQRRQRRLDLAQLDAVAADLDLLVGPAQVAQLPVRAPAHQVAGAIHPGSGFAERAGQEARGGQSRSAPIADADAVAGQVQLADHPGRHRAQPIVEHEERRPGHRGADRREARPGRQWCALAGPHGGFGGAVDVDHGAARRPAVHQLGRAGFGADHQRGAVQPVGPQQSDGRRGLGQDGDVFANEQVVELVRGARHRFGHHHQAAAVQQRAPDLPHREVEGVGMELGPHLPRRQLDADPQVVEELGDVVLRHRNAFGHTGGAGGVDDVGDVVGVGHRWRRRGLGGDGGVGDVDDGEVETVQPLSQRGGGDRDDRGGVGEHELDAGRRQRRVDRQIGRPRLERGQDGHDRLGRPGEQQRHPLTRAGAVVNHEVRQAVSRFVEFAVGHGPAVAGQRDRVGGARRLRGEPGRHRHRGGRPGQHRGVAPLFEPGVLVGVEQVDRRQAALRIGRDRRQQPLQPLDQALDGSAVEHVGAIFGGHRDAGALARLGEAFGQREGQVHAGGVGVQRHRGDLQVAQGQPGGRGGDLAGEVLPAEQHLHQRVVGHAPGRVEPLHQQLERHVLVLERGQAAPAHLGQQLGEGRVAAQFVEVDPQHQRVDEETDQLVEHGFGAARDRKAHGHIGTGADLGEQGGERGLDHHEAGRVVLAGHPAKLLLQFGRPVHRQPRAAVVGHRRVGPIGGQLQPFRQPGQRVGPEVQLGGDPAARIVDVAQMRALPQRVVGVLHRQRRPVGVSAGAPARIGDPEVPGERGDRPAVRGDVVHRDDQHVLVVAAGEKLGVQRTFGRQVEGVAGRGRHRLAQPVFRPAAGVDDVAGEADPIGRNDHLLRGSVGGREDRAQAFVPGHHVGQRRAQRVGVQPPGQPQRHSDVVHR